MSVEIKVPALPESVSEATVAAWHKQPGDPVVRDENLVDLETDKVVLEVPAPGDGVMGEITKEEGDTVVGGEVIGSLNLGEKAAATDESPAEESSSADSAQQQSPSVRRLLDEHGLDASGIKGSGKDGRLLKEDVEAHLASKAESASAAPAEPKAVTNLAPAAPAAPAPTESGPEPELPQAGISERVEQRVPMTRIRARIAERLMEAQSSTAMLTTFNEVDLFEVDRIRAKYKGEFEKTHDVRVGFMSFFVKAAIEGLKRYPVINASVDGGDVVYHGYYDIGIAVSSPRGLVVPIIRDADGLSFAEVEQSIRIYGKRARDNKLKMEDLSGGTFSITNGGVFGSMMSTPILNPPQSAILGMHNIVQRPMAVDGEVKIRPMMYLALTYDHRIIDGKEAVMFLRTIKDTLEDPARLLLQI